MDVYGDVEGNIEIINKIKQEFNINRNNIFLGDIISNYNKDIEFNNSIDFLEWLLKKYTKIEHKDLKNNIYLNSFDNKCTKLKYCSNVILKELCIDNFEASSMNNNINVKNNNFKDNTENDNTKNNIFFMIGNKEIKLYKNIKKLNINDYKLQILETYLSLCVPFIIYNHILFSHAYYMYDSIVNSLNYKSINKIIVGHSRSYGKYVYKNKEVIVIDLTSYYSMKRESLRFKKYGIPSIKLINDNNFNIENVEFYTEEFKLKPILNLCL